MQIKNHSTIRKTPTIKLLALCIISIGFYWYIWLWKLITDVNKLYQKRHIRRRFWFSALITLNILTIYMHAKGIQTKYIINLAEISWLFVQLMLSLQILKNIEAYVKNEFDIKITHNIFGWIFFGCFYINYRINRIPACIKKEVERKIKKLKG